MTENSKTTPGMVSIVICAWNNWPDLEMAIQSALHQSYQPIEVIVVDNSSTDATPEEVPRRFGRDVRYIRQPNRECAGAYNGGFAVARGEFIQFVDGDDVLAPNKIQKQVEVFRNNPDLDIVYGDVRMFQTTAGLASWVDYAMQPEEDMLKSLTAPPGILLNTLGVLFHRRVLEEVGPWDESLYIEDVDYWLRAAWAGCRFGYCRGGPMGFGRLRPGQKSRNTSAMARGIEAAWAKSLGYVTREPYRRLILASIAHWRFCQALSRAQMSKREALDMLALARSTRPETISALDYAVGCLTVILPSGFVHSRWARTARRSFIWLFDKNLGYFRRTRS